jgi:hypothetical protein
MNYRQMPTIGVDSLPLVYTFFPDRTGRNEWGMLNMAHAQMASFYDLSPKAESRIRAAFPEMVAGEFACPKEWHSSYRRNG